MIKSIESFAHRILKIPEIYAIFTTFFLIPKYFRMAEKPDQNDEKLRRKNLYKYLNLNYSDYFIKHSPKQSISDQKATKAFWCAHNYQRSRNKTPRPYGEAETSSGAKAKHLECDISDEGVKENVASYFRSNKLGKKSDHLFSNLNLDVLEPDIDSKREMDENVDNVIVHVDRRYINDMRKAINNLRFETCLLVMKNVNVTVKHIDTVCGLGKVETVNKWTVSLLPNRQIRLEEGDHCYCIRPVKDIICFDENIVVEGCLAPGGHLFRLSFTMDIDIEVKRNWLVISEDRRQFPETVIHYMINHPFESLDSLLSKLRIAFVKDPYNFEEYIGNYTEPFECYYFQRHFVYKTADRVGHIKIQKWGCRFDLLALFFIPDSGASDEEFKSYLIAITEDISWYRAWKAALFTDMPAPEDHLVKIGKIHKTGITPLKSDFLTVAEFEDPKEQFTTSKFIFDFATRQFSSVDFQQNIQCFAAIRIIANPQKDKSTYDFRVTGRSVLTPDVIDLKVRVPIRSHLQSWKDAVSIPFARLYAFLDMVLSELSEKGKIICGIDTEEVSSLSFSKVNDFISVLPKVEVVGVALSRLRAHHLEKLALLTFESMYQPIISIEEGEKIAEKMHQSFSLETILGPDRTRLLHRIHNHVTYENAECKSSKVEHLKPTSKLEIWRKIVQKLMRLDEFQQVEHEILIDNLAEYFRSLMR